MMLALGFLILDLFGLQIAGVGDVNQDGVAELLVTDPVGDVQEAREGRVLIVDVTNWTLVREIVGKDDEVNLGATASVAMTAGRGCVAVTSHLKDERHGRIHVMDATTFADLWVDDVELVERERKWGPTVLCTADSNGPSVFYFQTARSKDDSAEHVTLWRRDSKQHSLVTEFSGQIPVSYGSSLAPHYDDRSTLDGLVVSAIPDHQACFPRFAFMSGPSQVHWVSLPDGASKRFALEKEADFASGIVLLTSNKKHGRFACDALAVRRSGERGQVVQLFHDKANGRTLVPDGEGWYFGSSMCWLPDVDGDGIEELAIGCPVELGGVGMVLGSKDGKSLANYAPEAGEASIMFASGFGSQVCSIHDQDGDGRDDLVVAAVSPGGAGAYPAALSVVSTKTWKVIRVVFEKELAPSKSDKPPSSAR